MFGKSSGDTPDFLLLLFWVHSQISFHKKIYKISLDTELPAICFFEHLYLFIWFKFARAIVYISRSATIYKGWHHIFSCLEFYSGWLWWFNPAKRLPPNPVNDYNCICKTTVLCFMWKREFPNAHNMTSNGWWYFKLRKHIILFSWMSLKFFYVSQTPR